MQLSVYSGLRRPLQLLFLWCRFLQPSSQNMGTRGGRLKSVLDAPVGIKGSDGNPDERIFSGKEALT